MSRYDADRLARLADQVGLVRLEAVQGVAVFVRVDRDRANAQFVGRAEDANGDFAAIGDEQLGDLGHGGPRAAFVLWESQLKCASRKPGEGQVYRFCLPERQAGVRGELATHADSSTGNNVIIPALRSTLKFANCFAARPTDCARTSCLGKPCGAPPERQTLNLSAT